MLASIPARPAAGHTRHTAAPQAAGSPVRVDYESERGSGRLAGAWTGRGAVSGERPGSPPELDLHHAR